MRRIYKLLGFTSLLLGMACLSESKKQILEQTPLVRFTSPESDSTFEFGDEITFTGSVFDQNQDPDTLHIVWNSDRDAILSEDPADAEGTVTFTTSSLSPATHIISLTAIDDENTSAQDWILIEILD